MSDSFFELLAPAGSLETFKAVIAEGADAVYVGGDMFGARAYANNFSEEELIYAIRYAHLRGVKVFLTVNTLLKNAEIKEKLINYLKPFYQCGLDAVLVQDFGTLSLIHRVFPDLPIHTSTQMTVTSAYGAKFLKKYGVTRIVMAREVSLSEMKRIKDETGLEIEAFVHGALCYCYSGQCLFSSVIGGRSGNRGRCAQPCRLPYQVLDAFKKKIADETYILSLKDMCGIENLKELHEAGVYSLKIEGRMKQTEYAAGVVSYYRKYIDKYTLDHKKTLLSKEDKEAIYALGNRCGFTDKYYSRHNESDMITYVKPNFITNISEKYQLKESKLIATGYAAFKESRPAEFTVVCGEHSYTEYGNVVDKAKNSPVTEEQIRSRLNKTGDFDFDFDNIFIEMDDNIFVPNGELNRLRRDALTRLTDSILAPSGRKYLDIALDEDSFSDNSIIINNTLSVSIEDRSILTVCTDNELVDRIYLDFDSYSKKNFVSDLESDCQLIKGSGKEAYLILPAIFRATSADYFEKDEIISALGMLDGFVVKNFEELLYVKTYFKDKVMITDHNMYTYNDYAVKEYEQTGAALNTVPLELNSREIAGRNNSRSEMIIYGYYPLMTSAQCVNKNASGCDKCPKLLYLKDRYNKLFPVKNKCSECYNVIYNSLPTMLFSNLDKISACGVNNFRIAFTVEDEMTAAKILDLYQDYRSDSVDFEFTNGHFKRGVE